MIGIISDIHGNYAALSAVLNLLDKEGVSDIYCLGDVAGYYCQINECCEVLRQRGILSLMGNHDLYLVRGEDCPRSRSANVCLAYQRKMITKENLEWLATFPSRFEVGGIQMVHGGWNDPYDEYVSPSCGYFSSVQGSVFASGHTHVQCLWEKDGKTYCNPGSVGQPRDGDPRASYAIWNGVSFMLRRTEYDVRWVQADMAKAGFDPHYYENLARGTRIGGKVDGP